MCCGALPTPTDHGESMAVNTNRLCINPEGTVEGNTKPGSHVFDLMLNGSDADELRWMLDAIDGKSTSWRGRLYTTETTP